MRVHCVLIASLFVLFQAGCPTTGAPEGDRDADGHPDEGDCGPDDPNVYPGAPDVYGDGEDADCDDLDAALNVDDVDGDGWSTCDGDCDDGAAVLSLDDDDGDGDDGDAE